MFKVLLDKTLYNKEIDKIFAKTIGNKKLLDNYSVNKEVTLRWFLYNKNFVIKNIIKTLKQKNYKTPEAVEKKVLIKNKYRLLYAFDWHEKLLQSVLASMLTKHFENYYTDSLASYRKGRGTFETLKTIVDFLIINKDNNFYLIKTDISAYGDSIDHEILFNTLNKYITDTELLELLKKIINFKYYESETKTLLNKEIGLPTGSPLNNAMTNIFLNDLDTKIVELTKLGKYFRYGDDIFFISTDEDEFKIVKNLILENTNLLKLKINKDKFAEHIVEKNSTGDFVLKYLGFNVDFINNVISLTKEKDLELKTLLTELVKRILVVIRKAKYKEKEMLLVLIKNFKNYLSKSDFFSQLISFFGIVNDDKYWKNLDLFIAEIIVSSTYRLPKRKVFRKVSYKTLRQHGLPSLLHLSRIYRKGSLTRVYKYLK